MSFKFSEKSLKKLKKVHPALYKVMVETLKISPYDFGITEGRRTPARQLKLYNEGKSHIKVKSMHVIGKAVDIVIYIKGKVSWDHKHYAKVADAVRKVAKKHGVAIRWGGAWSVPGHRKLDIRKWKGKMAKAQQAYIKHRRAGGNKPFLDSPHLELV